jgi:ketosteroid isomerase-like protein
VTTFRQALEQHLSAIRSRDLAAFCETVATSGVLVITSDGRLVRDPAEFLKMHQDWFGSLTWSLDAQIIFVQEWGETGLAIVELHYRDEPVGARPVEEKSYLTLVFVKSESCWRMIFDQNTPCRVSSVIA